MFQFQCLIIDCIPKFDCNVWIDWLIESLMAMFELNWLIERLIAWFQLIDWIEMMEWWFGMIDCNVWFHGIDWLKVWLHVYNLMIELKWWNDVMEWLIACQF